AAGRPIGLVRFEALLGSALTEVLGQLDTAVTNERAPLSPDAKAAQASLAAALLAAGEPATDVIALSNALNEDSAAAGLRPGFPLCTGDVMATNPLWRQALAQWQAQVTGWVHSRGNQEIMFTDIFFDFRTIFGPPELAAALRRHVTAAAQNNLPFLAQISWLQHDRTSSVDWFGHLIAKDGPEQDAIDLKLRGTKPLVEIVRLLALKNGIEATGTPARLAALGAAGVLADEDATSLRDDVTFLLELLLRHQI